MDYKEKYEMALKRARDYKNNIVHRELTVGESIMDYIFPELKESEDERIRKEIIDFVKSRGGFKGDWIAWLEKQGETYTKKNIADLNEFVKEYSFNIPSDIYNLLPKEKQSTWINEIESAIKAGVQWAEKQGESYTKKDVDDAWLKGMCDAKRELEKQGEQKPFDYEHANIQQKDFAPQKDIPRYSIGDVLCDKSCTTLNKESQSNFEITDIRNGMYICDKCSFPISQQDEYELVAKRIEPAWSKEDEKMVDNILTPLAIRYPFDIYQPMYNWLKSLKERLQPQTTWKPSDEQMELLKDASARYEGLQSLYNDLNKLKGE